MKKIKVITLSFINVLFFLSAEATNYYYSSTGSNAANGLTPATAKQTLAQLNIDMSSFTVGDTVLFKRGDTLYGTINANKSGIIFAAYGTGPNPVITGFTKVTSWTNVSGNIWESSTAVSTLTTANMVRFNGRRGIIGRFPNTGWLSIVSHSGRVSITAPGINTSFLNSDAVVKINNPLIDINPVLSVSGNTATFDPLKFDGDPINGFGFFFQNKQSLVDATDEYYFNPTTKKITVYSVGIPVNVEVSTLDNLLVLGANTQSIQNLDFTGANTNTVFNSNNLMNGINFFKCKLSWAGNTGMSYKAGNGLIDSCSFNEINLTGAKILNGFGTRITNCTFRNIGLVPGTGVEKGSFSAAIWAGAQGGNTIITGNVISNCGLNGISYGSQNPAISDTSYIAYNRIDSTCMRSDDGGGIYGGKYATIEYNIITNIMGTLEGTNSAPGSFSKGVGIYTDDNSTRNIVRYNTIFNCGLAGIYGHNCSYSVFRKNLVYKAESIFLLVSDGTAGRVNNNIIDSNTFIAAISTQRTMKVASQNNDVSTFGVWGNNVYSRPLDNTTSIAYSPISGTSSNLSVASWKALFGGHDATSNNGAVTIASLNEVSTQVNYSPISVPFTFTGLSKKNVNGTVFNNLKTISPYGGEILFANGSVPVANAGSDSIVHLPRNTSTIVGAGSDADGPISSYNWVKVLGPSSGTITNPTSATSGLTSLVQGIYNFELTVIDNSGASSRDTVQVIVNSVPVVNAGTDSIVNLPRSTSTLNGTATDADDTISGYNWTKVSGPSSGTISNPTSATTGLSNLVQGIYKFELVVSDNRGGSSRDTVQVVVNSIPVVNAGNDFTIYSPRTTANIAGNATDADGVIISYSWAKISGPSSGTISSPGSSSSLIANLVIGVYQFELTATDNLGATGKDIVQVTVALPPNIPPVANAGSDSIVNLPRTTSTIIGTGTDADGTISSYSWVKISGPSSGTITNPSSANSGLTSLIQGTYKFELTVTDNSGASSKDTVQVTVNATPVVNAGGDFTIVAPRTTATIGGSATDADGTIISYSWAKISGPSSGTISSPSSSTSGLTNLVVGVYQFELTATDNLGAIGKDNVQVTVSAGAPRSANSITLSSQNLSQPIRLLVYPNPSTSNFNLLAEGDYKGRIKIVVTDLVGNPVYKSVGSFNNSYKFGSEFKNGVYFITILYNNHKTTFKLIKLK